MGVGRTACLAILAALGPTCPDPAAEPAGDSFAVGQEATRLAPLARRLALALQDPSYRRRVDVALAGRRWAVVDSAIAGGRCLLLSMPVPAHRSAWSGQADARLLVAVGLSGVPLAFDPSGAMHRLDPTRPPRTPVLVLWEPGERRDCHGWLCAGVAPLPRTTGYLLPEASPPDRHCARRPTGAAGPAPRITPPQSGGRS